MKNRLLSNRDPMIGRDITTYRERRWARESYQGARAREDWNSIVVGYTTAAIAGAACVANTLGFDMETLSRTVEQIGNIAPPLAAGVLGYGSASLAQASETMQDLINQFYRQIEPSHIM